MTEYGTQETAMRWVIFIVGLGSFLFSIWRRHKDGSGPQLIALLGIPGGLMLVALFAPVISSIELGPAKVNMREEKLAAATLIRAHPEVAEAITGQKGDAAVRKAIEQVEETKRAEQLHQFMPFIRQQNAIYFFPESEQKNRIYKVEPAIGNTTGRVQTLEFKVN